MRDICISNFVLKRNRKTTLYFIRSQQLSRPINDVWSLLAAQPATVIRNIWLTSFHLWKLNWVYTTCATHTQARALQSETIVGHFQFEPGVKRIEQMLKSLLFSVFVPVFVIPKIWKKKEENIKWNSLHSQIKRVYFYS